MKKRKIAQMCGAVLIINSLGLATSHLSSLQPTVAFAQAEEPEPDEAIMSVAEKNAILKFKDALDQFEDDLKEGEQELIEISIEDSQAAYESAQRTVVSDEGKAMLLPLIQRYQALKARAEQKNESEDQPKDNPNENPPVDPNDNSNENPPVDPKDNPNENPPVDPNDNSNENPPVDPKDNPNENPPVDPKDNPNENPPVDPKDNPNENPPVDPKDNPNENPPVDPKDNPNENPPADPKDEPKADPKVEIKEEVVLASIPYNKVREENPNLPKDVERVKTSGKEGVETITYQVTYTDGKVTGRREIKREVTTSAVDEIIEVGTKEARVISVIEIKTETNTEAIAYTTVYEENLELPKGEKRVKTLGQNGVERIIYQVTYTDGKVTNRTEVRREMITPVVNEVIEIGTKELLSPSPTLQNTLPMNKDSNNETSTQVYPQVQHQMENKQLPETGERAKNTGLISGLIVMGLAFVSFLGRGKKYKK
ncbi:G5 domain-containing protein [Streptococcus sp. 19428wC2_LYSM12]|uniref:G5 domain-containing protein n=1 Tax=unclassified Streptococcus TaxID=2608887 RepID=UPI0010727A51|nr:MULTISPECIES: G5 domain-containing protein [unclassified Streptococcus]MBF0786337.1 G5 domain-containing protein [Streptococcus sp. 19428wC2_LYSM12]TFV06748.1 LPXTG cell wall anchor domain-containing protein [Streptococcus sp. LYSM12]